MTPLVKTAMRAALAVACLLSAPAFGQDGGVIGAGDFLYVDVYRQPELSSSVQVDATGHVSLPYVGNVKIAGVDERQASALVASALSRILRNPRVTVVRSGVSAPATLGRRTPEMRTEVIPLQTADAEILNATLQGMTSDGGSINYHPDTNSLVVTDTPQAIQNIMTTIARLDQMEAQRTQVRIEAKIAEVQVGAMKELGVRWFVQGSEAGGGFYPMPTQTGPLSILRGSSADPMENERIGSSGDRAASSQGRRFVDEPRFDRRINVPVMIPKAGQMFFGLLNDHVDVGTLIDALLADDKADLLANPNILTINHKTAEIKMVDEWPYTEFGTEVSGRTTYATRFMDLGIKLVVTPHVYRDDNGEYVRLELEPEVSFPTGTSNGVPIRSVRSTKMEPLARNGQTVVVGGIYRNDSQSTEQRVPGLGRMPLLGNLFKHVERTRKQTELMVFVTPTIHRSPESVTWDRMINIKQEAEESPQVPSRLSRSETRRE